MKPTPWLLPEEHAEVVQKLYMFGLIKCSNKRDLALKSGGFTDIYINLREARSNPEAIKFITGLFAIPLQRLGIDRFVEVPDSFSCFAGPLSIMTGLPYLTIREQAKEKGASKGLTIGAYKFSDKVAILDDVITDGASKIVPCKECEKFGLDVESLVVLVDRQQGWEKKLLEAEVFLSVWPGLTLHDVRRELIEAGIMQRCDPKIEAVNPIIVAFDGKSWDEILPLADQLRTTGCIIKVNDLLFNEGIENLLPKLSVYGRIMADLKSYDIPNTIKNTFEHLKACPPWAVTVHASGGAKMIKEACDQLADTDTKVLAVTVLTSFDEASCEEIYNRLPLAEVLKLAEIANRAGAHGFVCSPEESKILKEKYPDKLIVTPGIRSEGSPKNDQERIATPKGAIDNGATNLVIGRQILGAANPVAEVKRILTEELGITL